MRKINRRQVLLNGCAAACCGVSAVSRSRAQEAVAEAATGSETKVDVIDAHSHIWTRDTQRYPLRDGVTVESLDPPSFTTAELLQLVRPLGVRRVVLIAHTQYYLFDNRYLTDAAAEQPHVFRVVGMVDDRRPDVAQRMRELQRRYVSGFRITPTLRGKATWLDNDGMRAMWECAADTRQAMCCLIDPEHLPQVDQMCGRFPETNVVIDHFARIGIDGQIRAADLDALCRLARFPHVYVKVSAFYALGEKRPPHDELIPMIRKLCDVFGPQRLMWASDAPYQIVAPNSYQASLALVRDRIDFLSPEDRRWLLRGTAEQVFCQ